MDRDRGVMLLVFLWLGLVFTVYLICFFGLSPMFTGDTNLKATAVPTFNGEKSL